MRYSTRSFADVTAPYSGWEGYGLLNVAFYLDRKHRFRVGTTPKFYVIRSTRSRRDRWFVLPAEPRVRRQFLKGKGGSCVSKVRTRNVHANALSLYASRKPCA